MVYTDDASGGVGAGAGHAMYRIAQGIGCERVGTKDKDRMGGTTAPFSAHWRECDGCVSTAKPSRTIWTIAGGAAFHPAEKRSKASFLLILSVGPRIERLAR